MNEFVRTYYRVLSILEFIPIKKEISTIELRLILPFDISTGTLINDLEILIELGKIIKCSRNSKRRTKYYRRVL